MIAARDFRLCEVRTSTNFGTAS